MVTVAGLLLVKPSLTINWITYVPAASATNTDEALVAARSGALLNNGRLMNDHEKVRES